MSRYSNTILLPRNIGSMVEYEDKLWIVKAVWMDMCGLNYSIISVDNGKNVKVVQYKDVVIVNLYTWTDRDDVIMNMLNEKTRDAMLDRDSETRMECLNKIREIQGLIWREQLKVARDTHIIE